MKLSKAQREALEKLSDGAERPSYDLGVSRSTLFALQRRSLVKQHLTAASHYVPQIGTLWSITAAGRKALADATNIGDTNGTTD